MMREDRVCCCCHVYTFVTAVQMLGEDIGVITPYRAQLRLFTALLRQTSIECNTVDRVCFFHTVNNIQEWWAKFNNNRKNNNK